MPDSVEAAASGGLITSMIAAGFSPVPSPGRSLPDSCQTVVEEGERLVLESASEVRPGAAADLEGPGLFSAKTGYPGMNLQIAATRGCPRRGRPGPRAR